MKYSAIDSRRFALVGDGPLQHVSRAEHNLSRSGFDLVESPGTDAKIGVVRRPETRYTSVGDADIAYQVVGEGPDLLYFQSLGGNWDAIWQLPELSEPPTRFSSFCRMISFDRRGIGASDGVPLNAIPTWEDLAEDAGVVLDAAGSKQAAIFAHSDSGPMALLFAATHPERVSALALFCTYARRSVAEDYPIGIAAEEIDRTVESVRRRWGSPDLIRPIAPNEPPGSELIDRMAWLWRMSATPRTAAAQYDYLLRHMDARAALPLIRVPTLVFHPKDAVFYSAEQSRYLAENIQGARFIEVQGTELGPIGDTAEIVAEEIAELLTGQRSIDPDRVLTTILFTDIAESTATASSVGDRRWRSILDSHDRAVRQQLRRFKGREVKTTGDGFVASFDGPARAIRCARAITEATTSVGVGVRTGLHTGECEVRGDDLGGLAVHIAARVGALASPGETLVSGTVKDLVAGSEIEFDDRGERELKGVPGKWRLFAVSS